MKSIKQPIKPVKLNVMEAISTNADTAETITEARGPKIRPAIPAMTAGGIRKCWMPFTLTLISLPRSISAEMMPRSTTIVQGVNVSITYFSKIFCIFSRKASKRLSALALNFLTFSILKPSVIKDLLSFSPSAISLSSAFTIAGRMSLRRVR